MQPLRSILPGLASGFAAVLNAVIANAAPEQPLSVSQWAEAHRYVGEDSQSRHAGKWENARTPYLCEPMDSCQLGNGVRRVVLTGGAQFGKSEVSLNAIAWAIDYEPCGIFCLLPSLDETRTYSRLKWEPTVEASERLRRKVHLLKSRANDGSTTAVKKFDGGSLELVTAGASKALQMRTGRMVVAEECSQYDVGEDGSVGVGGDPITAAEVRCDTFGTDAKTILVSTPGFAGRCRITAEYNASDQRRWYMPCPQCGDAFVLDIATLHAHEGRACMLCPSCGFIIEESDRADMLAGGFWLPTFTHAGENPEMEAKRAANPAPPKIIPAADIDLHAPFDAELGYRFAVRDCEGRSRGYHLWQGQASPDFASWERILDKKQKFEAGQFDPIEYAQKVLGEPYEEIVDRPDSEKLYEHRGLIYPAEGAVPSWASIVTGFIDVQANRFEWGVYAWGKGGVGARITKGIIAKSPNDIASWRDVSALVNTQFSGPAYRPRRADYWGIDLGGHATEEVYNFVLAHRALNVLALKGSSHDGGNAPAYERGKTIKVRWKGQARGRIIPIITGTHGLKTRIYHALLQGVESARAKPVQLLPRSLHFGIDATKTDFAQLTAEHIKQDDPRRKGVWVLPAGKANEQLDIAVGCLALAIMEGLDLFDELTWQRRHAERMPPLAEQNLTPLEMLMHEKRDAAAPAEAAVPPLEPPPAEGVMSSGPTEEDLAALEALGASWGNG